VLPLLFPCDFSSTEEVERKTQPKPLLLILTPLFDQKNPLFANNNKTAT